jgi:antitoxin ParD1/3/4
MPKTAKKPATMNVHVGPRFRKLADDLVKSGRYGSASEVVRAAMRILEAEERELAADIEALRVGIEDMEAGRTRPLGEVFADLERKYPMPRRGKRMRRGA